jgi:cholinesterase
VQKISLMIAAVTILPACAVAGPFTSIVVYGDSLSDNGNLYSLTSYPPWPYYAGRFSNGPVAIEHLASIWNAALIDHAVAGATTGIGNIGDAGTPTLTNGLPGITATFQSTQGTLNPRPDQFFIVWGGTNDFISPSAGDSMPADVIARAVTNLSTVALTLEALGAQHILVIGMPDLGLTPHFRSQGALAAAQATALTDAFNTALRSNLPAGVMYYDAAGLLRAMISNPAAYGLSNVTDPCITSTSICSSPNIYLFWDDMHPTTAAHAALANSIAAQTVAAQTVPEPATVTLTLVALILLAAARTRTVRSTSGTVHGFDHLSATMNRRRNGNRTRPSGRLWNSWRSPVI